MSRLGQAEQQQSFQGTFVYERNGSFSTHSIWHLVQNGQVRERLLQLDGSAQEVVRVDGRTECVSGTLVAGLGASPDAHAHSLDPQKLKAWYDISVAGKSRVALERFQFTDLNTRDIPQESELQGGADCKPVALASTQPQAKVQDGKVAQQWHSGLAATGLRPGEQYFAFRSADPNPGQQPDV